MADTQNTAASGNKLSNIPAVTTLSTDDTVVVIAGGSPRQYPADKFLAADNVMDKFAEAMYYGVEWDTASTSPECTRIGNPTLHRTLPVHSKMRGVLLDDDGNVTQVLPADTWVGQTLDGSAGQVMVETPEGCYWKFETDGTKLRVKLSEMQLPGFKPMPHLFVSAYEAALDRTALKLCSVKNTTAQFRGGNNNAQWDGTYRSLLGMPATVVSLSDFRTYARKRKAGSTEWNCMTYVAQKLLYWLFVTEYATLNTQKAYNAQPDANGFKQGGLGDGVTTTTYEKWVAFNSQNPLVPCGTTDSLGNSTGCVAFTFDDGNTDASKRVKGTFQVPRYRGVENPFGHLWQWTDGILCLVSPETANGGDGTSKCYVCDDTANYASAIGKGYKYIGDIARGGDYVKKILFGDDGDIMPSEVGGGGSNSYYCDYYYTAIPNTGKGEVRGVYFGGHSYDAAYAGFVYASTADVPSFTLTTIASRLCFIPN